MTPSRYRAAVQSAWQVYMALPSPIRATTGRSGSASCTPIAAGRPQPIPPPRSPKKLCGSSLRTSVRSPPLEEIDSSTTTASGGSASAMALIAASDVIGTRSASLRARARSSSMCRVLSARVASSRSRACRRRAGVIRASSAARSSGSVAFGSPRIATPVG